MKSTTSAFASAVQALSGATGRRLRSHPLPEELIAYADETLLASQRDRIRDHLTLCHDCSAAVLDLLSFPDVPCRDERPDPNEPHVTDWASMRSRLVAGGHLTREEPVVEMFPEALPGGPAVSRAQRFYRWALAVAAVIIVTLSGWIYSMRETLGAFSHPRINAYYHDLIPLDEDQRRDQGSLDDITTISVKEEFFLLVLNIGERGSFPDYEVEIRKSSEDKPLWRQKGFLPSRYGTFNLEIHRKFLPAGVYDLQLRGVDGQRSEILGDYRVRIIYE